MSDDGVGGAILAARSRRANLSKCIVEPRARQTTPATAPTIEASFEWRPHLKSALKQAAACKSPIVVGKLDRLSRDVAFISGLMAQGCRSSSPRSRTPIRSCCTSTPPSPSGAHEDLGAHQGRAAAAKARGVKLGNPHGPKPFTAEIQRQGVAALRERAAARAQQFGDIFAEYAGVSANAVAKALNERGLPSWRGGKWTARSVINLRARLEAAS